MLYSVLGPLRVIDEGTARTPSAGKVRVLLATLLMHVGDVVSTTELMEEIWGSAPPRRADAAIHVYVSHARKLLNATTRGRSDRIVTRAPGYLLELGDDQLDSSAFERAFDEGRAQFDQRRYFDASDTFGCALGMWGGSVLTNVEMGPSLRVRTIRLEEMRLIALELKMNADLALGRHQEVSRQLAGLTREHPMREAFHGQFMLALYRSQRQAEALRVYLRLRTTLREELGLEPCRPVQELQQAILKADPRLELQLVPTG
ncbi:BTAD domain-containing putative transcriptional regulator [Microbispora sp. NPDC049125]|uniref:AfsR/SARP family transcriptional regulator n=1 Tax=Microbispora sp. NPDC049125 TaxID=3154929 RepID=UPI003466960E